MARTDHAHPHGTTAASILFAGALVIASRSKYVLSLPALLLGATGLAHVARHAAGISVASARAFGWLLDVPSRPVLPMVWLVQHWQAPQANELLRQGGEYVALVVVTAFTLMLGITSIEIDAHLSEDIDVDRELRVNGLANVAASLAGGMVGTLSLSRTLFNLQNGTRSRVSGIIVAGACLATLAFGTGALAYVPVPVSPLPSTPAASVW